MRLRRRHSKGVPGLNTASLPDLIFTVLFFFMIVTHMRQTDVKVQYVIPEGDNLSELHKKQTVTYLYIGKDKNGDSVIQVNNEIVPMEKLANHIFQIKKHIPLEEQENYTISIKADRDTPLSIIHEVKEALRKADALKVHYSADPSQDPTLPPLKGRR